MQPRVIQRGGRARRKPALIQCVVTTEEQHGPLAEVDRTQKANSAVFSAAESSHITEKDEPCKTEEKDSDCKDNAEEVQPVVENENSAEQPSAGDQLADIVSSSEQKPDLSQTSEVNIEGSLPEKQLSADSNCDSLIQEEVTPCSGLKDHAKDQCDDGIAAEADVTSSVEHAVPHEENDGSDLQPQFADSKHTEHPRAQLKHDTNSRDVPSKDLQLVDKNRALHHGGSKNRRKSGSMTREERSLTNERYGQHKQDVKYSTHDSKEIYTSHATYRREKRYSAERFYYGGRDYREREIHRFRGYEDKFDARSVFLSLEDISSDEEHIEYQDSGNHCCQFCTATFDTIPTLLEHLQTAAHEQVF